MSQKCSTIGSKIKSFLAYINIFDIPRLTREISCDVKLIRDRYDETIKAIEEYKKELELERDKRSKERNLFLSVLDHLDDMVWAKDLEGKYIVANKAFREKFCYGITWDELQGMTDVELAKKFKKQVGELNHTFGEKCVNSDQVVTESMVKQRFMESGKVKGKMLYLEVYKAPLVVDGEFIGVFGSGRDMTEYVEAYIQQRELLKKLFPNLVAKFDNIFAKYSFESDIQ